MYSRKHSKSTKLNSLLILIELINFIDFLVISEGVGVNQLAQIYLILDPIFDSDPSGISKF